MRGDNKELVCTTLPPLLTPRGSHVSTHREGSHLQPKGRALTESNQAGTLMLNFQSPELGESKLLSFKPPSL